MNTTNKIIGKVKGSDSCSSTLNEDSSRISVGSTNRSRVENRSEAVEQKTLFNFSVENYAQHETAYLYDCSKALQKGLRGSTYLNCVDAIVNDFVTVSQYSNGGKYSIDADALDQAIVHDSNSGEEVKVKDLIIEKIKRNIVFWIMTKKYPHRNLEGDYKVYSSGEFYQFQEICCGQLFNHYKRLKPSLEEKFPDFFNPWQIDAWKQGEAVLCEFMGIFYKIELQSIEEGNKDIYSYAMKTRSFILENYK